MIKPLLMAVAVIGLSACAANPEKTSANEFASNTEVELGYNSVKIAGSKISLKPTAEHGVKASNTVLYLLSELPRDNPQNAFSYVFLDVSYFQTSNEFTHAKVNSQLVDLEDRKVSSQMCNDNCVTNQWVKFPVATADIIDAREQGLPFELLFEGSSKGLKYVIPAVYIDGMMLRYKQANIDLNTINGQAGNAAAGAAVVATPVAAKAKSQQSTAVEMTEYWFAKVSSAEQEAFISWALKNRKKIDSPLQADNKEMEMLAYWYDEATVAERSELLTWAVENIK
ncbi:hypothetical protein Q4519_04470 [Motilimonas sp. 1_MG-2023]|uniref:hypothetical protein n=1 Tax=Motilimonas sp. 1_MG-2023 TaxID=3062672 RepID=UPI0026E251FB|nr:hypothetical protein [Motilimonas sp. 1_MG-2023]MDO6524932.1 hypothetical protein [Motilimonas sp. 1_MG-2023]